MCDDDGYEDSVLDFFEPYDEVVMNLAGARTARGFLLQVTDRGIVWGRTHKNSPTGSDDWEELKRPILTFTRFGLVDQMESFADTVEEGELRTFADLLTDVQDAGDFAAITESATDNE